MNDYSSPAPKRRRRDAQTPIPPMPNLGGEAPAPARAPKRRRRRRSALNRLEAGFRRLPPVVRLIAAALCTVLIFTLSVQITRSYLAAQEERRRLEAEAAERAQHPLYYEEYIREYAAQRDLDPALVAAVILCESSYNPQAESRLGARGLMQLMEDTAGWVAHKLGEDNSAYSFDLLYDPETNIRFGCWYLGYLSRRWDGDALKIVCGYHAGQGNVDNWLTYPEYSSDGVTLDVVPKQDTAAYASRVLAAQAVYQKYYFPVETPLPPEEETPAP